MVVLGSRSAFVLAVLLVIATWLVQIPVANAATITAIAVGTNLNDPTAFTFAPDGRIFYAERSTGAIRILDPATGVSETYFTIPKVVAGDGIVGLALHPRFPDKGFVYAYGSRMVGGIERDQLIRISGTGTLGTSMKVLESSDAGTVSPAHHGGRLLFGPDRRLYLMVGDAGTPANAQDLSAPYGKILRFTPSGAVPADNPIAGSPLFAYGLRNSIGMAFDPLSGRLWESDNGPECNDEVNTIVAGANYGWGPSETCSTPPDPPMNTNQDGADPVLPVAWFVTPIAPTGVTFCLSCHLGAGVRGNLLVGGYLDGQVLALTLDASRTSVTSQRVLYTNPVGIRSVESSPSGAVYFSDATAIFVLER